MKNFKNNNQMKAFMKKEALRLGISISSVYSTFVSRAFLERLSVYGDRYVLVKGSAAETIYLGRLVRAITDVDIASLKEFNVNDKYFLDVLRDDSINGITFDFSKDVFTTKTGIKKLSLVGSCYKMKQPLNVDLQNNYSRLIEMNSREVPAIFEDDNVFNVNVSSFEEYLADKMCIILENNKVNVLNTRVKDFYDIYELHGGKYDPELLTKYFGKIIKLRGKINIENASTLYLNRRFIVSHYDVWNSTKERYDFLDKDIDLEGAVYYTRAVLREQLQKNGQVMEKIPLGRRK